MFTVTTDKFVSTGFSFTKYVTEKLESVTDRFYFALKGLRTKPQIVIIESAYRRCEVVFKSEKWFSPVRCL